MLNERGLNGFPFSPPSFFDPILNFEMTCFKFITNLTLSLFQVELDSLTAGVSHVEETLQRLSDEQLSGQLAVVKVGIQR